MAGNDIDRESQASAPVKIIGVDEQFIADVKQVDGVNRLATDSAISSVNVPLGKDPLPDTYFKIVTAGAVGDEVTIDIQGTANDSTVPDTDFPSYSFTYTLVIADVGDEQQLCKNIADALNADPLFEAQFLEAFAIGDDGDENLRPIVHITSTRFSLNGEFYERPNVGDFEVTTTGTTVTQFFSSDYRKIVSRPKEVSLARDPRNPHRLGIQNISGTVFIRSNDPEKIFREYLLNGGSPEMNVNATPGSPDIFEIAANADGEPDIIIDSIKFLAVDGNIKVQPGNFLGQNSALNNGIIIELIRDGIVIFTQTIINTPELLGQFSSTASDNKIINQSGGDYLESTFSLIDSNVAFVLRNGENDAVRVTIQDTLANIDLLRVLAAGQEE